LKGSKDSEFWLATIIIIITIALSTIAYLRLFNLNFFIGPYRLTHWFTLIGTFFIAIYSPFYYFAKRKYPRKIKSFLRVHVFGNLFSFMLITIHFAQQISRPEAFFPDLSTGLLLYIVMPILVATGYLHRFQVFKNIKPHTNRFLHVSLTFTFYLTILVHILQGLNII
jgi:uncharacterized membrane protein YidH (DUF202 family)